MPVTHGVAGSSPVQTAKKPNATRWAFCIHVRSKTGFSEAHECKKHPHRRCKASLLVHPLGVRQGAAAPQAIPFPSHVRSKTGFSEGHECKKHPHRRCKASLLVHPLGVRQGAEAPQAIPFLDAEGVGVWAVGNYNVVAAVRDAVTAPSYQFMRFNGAIASACAGIAAEEVELPVPRRLQTNPHQPAYRFP